MIYERLLTTEDWHQACAIVGARIYEPDLVIAPDGLPYLYRWYLVPGPGEGDVYERMKGVGGLVMFHIQVRSDPERPLHDHPWDNQSVILAGAYEEIIEHDPHAIIRDRVVIERRPGDVIWRRAEEAHRLVLPEGVPYAMTLFSTGPKTRSWGFWYEDGWHDHKQHVDTRDGVSVHVNRGES